MNYVLGDMVPAALAVALSPFPIIAIVVVLSTPRARSNGPLFALGWVLGLVAVSTVVVLLLGNVDNESSASTTVSVLRVVLGAGLLLLATKQWSKRPRHGEDPTPPPWMATVETATPGRTLVLGLALAGANPKNLALTLAASASISRAGLDAAGTVIALAVFVAIGSCTVLGAVIYHLLAGDRATAPLAKVKRFMLRHNNVIMMVILLVLGGTILLEGVAGLRG